MRGVLSNRRFARFFLNKALGKYNYFDDLRSLDGDLYGNLVRLKHMNPAEVDALDLSFAITVNGRDMHTSDTETKVTAKNRSQVRPTRRASSTERGARQALCCLS